MMPIATMALRMLVPRLAIKTTANKMAGNEKRSSMARIIIRSGGAAPIGGGDADHGPAEEADRDGDDATCREMRAA